MRPATYEYTLCACEFRTLTRRVVARRCGTESGMPEDFRVFLRDPGKAYNFEEFTIMSTLPSLRGVFGFGRRCSC